MTAGELVEPQLTDIHLGPGIIGFELATWTLAERIRILLGTLDKRGDR